MTADHRCIAGLACRSASVIDGRRTPAIVVDTGTLCDACETYFANCCHQLTRDYRQLQAALGERQTNQAAGKVSSTPTPALPINTQAEAVMTAIVDAADRAAAVVADRILNTTQHAGRRNTTPDFRHHGETIRAHPASIAKRAETLTLPGEYHQLETAVRLVEPHVAELARISEHDAMLWLKPQRCDRHASRINVAQNHLEYAQRKDREHAERMLAGAYRAAANCDACNGWYQHGQAREITTQTGLELVLAISDVHHQARAHLGHTRLRHHFNMPCPAYDRRGEYCGAMTVGRDDGTDWVNCTTCGAQWTEREYDWLKTIVVEDKEIDMLRYLLAEAYYRLDQIDEAVTNSAGTEALELPGAGTILHNHIADILDGHTPPDKRKTAA